MYYRSHKWVDVPGTTYERRRELRVRESKHTVMLFDRKYQDIDTGKFDTDKIRSLNSCTIGEIFSSCSLQNMAYEYEPTITNEAPRDIEKIKAYDDIRASKLKERKEERAREQQAAIDKERKTRARNMNREARAAREEIERRALADKDHALWLEEERAREQRERKEQVNNIMPNRFANWRYVGIK